MNSSTFQTLGEFDDCFGVWEPQQPPSQPQNSLFQILCQEIDDTSEAIMTSKFNKLAKEFLNDTCLSLQHMCSKYFEIPKFRKQIDIRFELLQVDHANLQQLPKFYQILKKKTKHEDRDKIFSGDMTHSNNQVVSFNSRMTHLTNEHLDSSQLLNEICDHLKKQYKHPAHIYTSLFLVEHNYTVANLQELQKTLLEEMEFNLQCDNHHSVVIVIPASQQLITNYQINGLTRKKYIFTDPRKMFTSLLVELLKNTRVPLLSRNLYKELIQSFGIYATTYAQQVHHFKLAIYQYIKECPIKLKDRLEQHLADVKVEDKIFNEYLSIRSQIKFGMDTLQFFIKQLKKKDLEALKKFQLLDTKSKLFSVICRSQSNFFQLPQGLAEESTLKHLLDNFILSVRSNVLNCSELCKTIEMNVETGYQSQAKPKKDRAMQMIQSIDQKQKYLYDKKDRLEFQINKFIKENIIDLVALLETQKSEFIFYDSIKLQKVYAPDIFQDYHNILYKEEAGYDPNNQNVVHTPYHHIRNFYASIGSGGFNVRASDLQNEMPQYPQHRAEAFHYGLGEMKILGLIEDTKKVQMTFQKSFFAKGIYQAYKE